MHVELYLHWFEHQLIRNHPLFCVGVSPGRLSPRGRSAPPSLRQAVCPPRAGGAASAPQPASAPAARSEDGGRGVQAHRHLRPGHAEQLSGV